MTKYLSLCITLVLGGCAMPPSPPMSEREYRNRDLRIQREQEAYQPPVR